MKDREPLREVIVYDYTGPEPRHSTQLIKPWWLTWKVKR